MIGVSGGLDSTQALIVAAKTMDRLGWPRNEYSRVYDAGFRDERFDASGNAHKLMETLGVTANEIDIKPCVPADVP